MKKRNRNSVVQGSNFADSIEAITLTPQKDDERIYGLKEIINQDAVILILGTLPGTKSIRMKEYYSDPTNKFWNILFQVCGEPFNKSYEAKITLLKNYKIALWDVLKSAVRKSSGDNDITEEEPNDLPRLLRDYPNIKLILFHSKDAFKYFKRFFKNTMVPYICVASPSGNNTTNVNDKVSEWRAALSPVIPRLHTGNRLEWRESNTKTLDYIGIKRLCSFIPYFENVDSDQTGQLKGGGKNGDGVISLPYPEYDKEFIKFVDAFYKSGLSVNDYQTELNQKLPNWQTIDIDKVIETADYEFIKVILTKSIRVERFCEGAWERAIKNGVFLNILRRLNVLLATEKI